MACSSPDDGSPCCKMSTWRESMLSICSRAHSGNRRSARHKFDGAIGSAATADGCPQTAYGERDTGPDEEARAQGGDGGDGLTRNAAGLAGMREADPGSQTASRAVLAEGFPFYEISAGALEGELGAKVGPAAVAGIDGEARAAPWSSRAGAGRCSSKRGPAPRRASRRHRCRQMRSRRASGRRRALGRRVRLDAFGFGASLPVIR